MSLKEKPQLHQSHLTQLSRCGEKFKRVYLLGHKEPNTIPLIQGVVSHETAAMNLQQKIETKTLKCQAEIMDITRDSFEKNWNEKPIMFSPEERDFGIEKTKGFAIDQTISLTTLHANELAPYLNPVSIERNWVVKCEGYDFDLSGTFDVEEERTAHLDYDLSPRPKLLLRDLKNLNKNPGQSYADNSEQMSFYGLAKYVIDGVSADEYWMDILVKSKKSIPYLVSYKTYRDEGDFRVAKLRFERANEIVRAGAFAPASRSDWWCSVNFCGFAADGSCPFFNKNPKNISMATTKQQQTTKEKSNGKRTITIKASDPNWSIDGVAEKLNGNSGKDIERTSC